MDLGAFGQLLQPLRSSMEMIPSPSQGQGEHQWAISQGLVHSRYWITCFPCLVFWLLETSTLSSEEQQIWESTFPSLVGGQVIVASTRLLSDSLGDQRKYAWKRRVLEMSPATHTHCEHLFQVIPSPVQKRAHTHIHSLNAVSVGFTQPLPVPFSLLNNIHR